MKPEVYVAPCAHCSDKQMVYVIQPQYICSGCGEVLPAWQKTEQGYKFIGGLYAKQA